MGYTHYWDREKKDHTQKEWDAFIKDCKILYKNMPEHSLSAGAGFAEEPLYLSGCFSYKYPQFTKEHIVFNGSSKPPKERKQIEGSNYWEGDDLDHETFILSRQYVPDSESFCKTARKPYDLMVTACLILYKYHCKGVTLSSDGDKEDWEEGYKFVASVFPDIVFEEVL